MEFVSMIMDIVFGEYIVIFIPFIIALMSLLFVDRLVHAIFKALDLRKWR